VESTTATIADEGQAAKNANAESEKASHERGSSDR
jgi:hypothetical protein